MKKRILLSLAMVFLLVILVGYGDTRAVRAQSLSATQSSAVLQASDQASRLENYLKMVHPSKAKREAAAARSAKIRGKAARMAAASPGNVAPKAMPQEPLNPLATPDYFGGTVPNYANSPVIRKFVDTLPGLGLPGCTVSPVNTCNANNLGLYIPIATKLTPPVGVPADGDYYEIGVEDFFQPMHSDLIADVNGGQGTKLRGFFDLAPTADGKAHYLGPMIIAERDKPVRMKFTNMLGTGAAGNFALPVDTSLMGAGTGPDGTHIYTQNRTSLHLHGGDTPWISDGTPHQWITPETDTTNTIYTKGDSQQNVPDMWYDPTTHKSVAAETPGATNDPGPDSETLYYTNHQSSRLMFYHEHALGTTRLGVYAGEVAGYLITDPYEEDLISGTNVTGANPGFAKVLPDLGGAHHYGIPLIIQDKSFVPVTTPQPIQSIAVLAQGSGYSSTPTITISDASGQRDTARATVVGGAITTITPNNPGTLYTSNPTVAIADATGADASAFAFVPTLSAEDPTWDTANWGGFGNLWLPHVYMPNQNPADFSGANSMGRWDYGPWFWPPYTPATGLIHGPIANPLEGEPNQPDLIPGVPNPTIVPEAFMDTPLVNGVAYPVLQVERKAYRFRILNASNDRALNLQLYYAANAKGKVCRGGAGKKSDCTEVKMVPAVPPTKKVKNWPDRWPTDGRDGGVPDPGTMGPSIIQIGNECGFLPAPVVLPNTPIGYNYNRRDIVVLNVENKTLLLGPAERADIIIDFSQVKNGSKIVLYNDAPAPVPAFDTRYDYYTGDPDQTATGGAPTTRAGKGPNTRTVMLFQVSSKKAAPPLDLAALNTALPVVYAASQDKPLVPQSAYNAVYGTDYTDTPGVNVSNIEATSLTYAPFGSDVEQIVNFNPKAIQELFELNYGRMNATLGVELPFTNSNNQTTIPLGYIDPPTEIIHDGETQIWKITHNGVDTHAIHFHLFNVQLINRVGWDGAIRMPDPNELGWKEVVRMNPLEDVIVALKPVLPTVPFEVPLSTRLLDPTQPAGSTDGFWPQDANGNPVTTVNQPTLYGWEYVWHCHLLGHEENDMMRPIVILPHLAK